MRHSVDFKILPRGCWKVGPPVSLAPAVMSPLDLIQVPPRLVTDRFSLQRNSPRTPRRALSTKPNYPNRFAPLCRSHWCNLCLGRASVQMPLSATPAARLRRIMRPAHSRLLRPSQSRTIEDLRRRRRRSRPERWLPSVSERPLSPPFLLQRLLSLRCKLLSFNNSL